MNAFVVVSTLLLISLALTGPLIGGRGPSGLMPRRRADRRILVPREDVFAFLRHRRRWAGAMDRGKRLSTRMTLILSCNFNAYMMLTMARPTTTFFWISTPLVLRPVLYLASQAVIVLVAPIPLSYLGARLRHEWTWRAIWRRRMLGLLRGMTTRRKLPILLLPPAIWTIVFAVRFGWD